MNKKDILEILKDVFVGFEIIEEDKSKFSKIYVRRTSTLNLKYDLIKVFTYSSNIGAETNWYINIYFNSRTYEIMIPNGIERYFLEDFLLIYNDVENLTHKVNELESKLIEVKNDTKDIAKLISKYRDSKLKKLGIY